MSDTVTLRYLAPILCLCVTAQVVFARIGSVQTRQGNIFTGHTRLIHDGVVVVNASRNLVTALPGSNVISVVFAEEQRREPEEAVFGMLPGNWREQQIGPVAQRGSTRVNGRTFTVRGMGSGMDGQSDSFHYAYQPVQGDYEIVARVTTIQQTSPRARAGLMMRDTMSEHAGAVSLTMTPGRGGAFQVRSAGSSLPQAQSQRDLRPPYWLKLRRRGNEFFGYKSRDGRRWTLIEQAQLPMSSDYYVGLAVASDHDRQLNWSTFDHVRTGPKLRTENFTPRVELTSGSVIRGRPLELQGNDIRFEEGRRVVRVPSEPVARIIYQPLNAEIAWKARASRGGVWMTSGDFFEGALVDVSPDTLRVSSVLYGLRTFDITDEVLAVVLKNGERARNTIEVWTVDGSMLIGTSPTFANGELTFREAALGMVHLPASAVQEFRIR